MQLTEKFSVGTEDKLFGDIIQDMYEESQAKLIANNKQYGLPSKFTKLNNYFQYEKGELVVVAAKRKVGKSTYAMNECLFQLEQGRRVLYLDSELTSKLMMNRLISLKAKVNNLDLKSGNLSVPETERVQEAIQWFKDNKNFVHIYSPNWTKEKIFAVTLFWKQKMGVDLLIYDYMKSSGDVLGASEAYNSLGSLCNYLKNDISGGLDISVLALAQLSRSGEIADSFKIEMFCSTMLTLNKKTEAEINNDDNLGHGLLGNYKCAVKLNRNGDFHDDPSEYVDINFDGKHFDFQDIPNSPINHPKCTPYDK